MTPTLVIPAAGAGSRYGGLKQLSPIGPDGEALLEYSVFDALRAGFGQVVLVVRPETEASFRERFQGKMDRHVEIHYAHQTLDDLPDGLPAPEGRKKPWGTGHAVLAATEQVDGPFGVINADDFYGAESYVALAGALDRRQSAEPSLAVVGFPIGETLSDAGPVSRALCQVDEAGHLSDITELHAVWREDDRVVYRDDAGSTEALRGDELVSMNMWGFTPALFPELRARFRDFVAPPEPMLDEELLLPDVIRQLIREGTFEVEVIRGAGEWCGVTFREDRERVAGVVSDLVVQGAYPESLWA